jgi:uncharacterized protein (DUF2252 family)
MNIVKATRQFEEWLGRRTDIVQPDLELKHKSMKETVFPFLRATFYRWAQIWPSVCPELAKAPQVLAVGDLHVENFGTWRDIEGRLIWGVNDFDEAFTLAYANDLVRLAVSAMLAAEAGHLALKEKDICDTILDGYIAAMDVRGCPYVLGEKHTWLRQIAESELRDPVRFWQRMDALPTLKQKIPLSARAALNHLMPERNIPCRIVRRVAGLGSLGHQRFVAIANWHGGKIAREAKALVPSSCHWAQGETRPSEILYQTIIACALRCPDPFVQQRGRWIIRRLGPHCSRIELSACSAPGAELRLIHAMGWETANIHLGTKDARKSILQHLKKQKKKWLHEAACEMRKAVYADWQSWKKDGYA